MQVPRLAKPATRKKRGKFTIALLAPLLIIVFIVGWSLYWVGRPRKPNTKPQQETTKTPAEPGNVDLCAIPLQEQEVLAN